MSTEASSSSVSAKIGGGKLFVRQATGLVRELSMRDNILLAASYISVFLGFTYLTLVPSTFVGANVALAFLITFLLMVPHFIVYGLLSSAMPRSGGDYLFLSRIVHPITGFIVNGMISLVFIAGLGNVALVVPQFGLPAMFDSLGFITGDVSWINTAADVNSQTGQFLIAGGLIVITGVIALFSVRAVARWNAIFLAIGLIGAFAAIIGLIGVNTHDFSHDFQRVGSYQDVLNAAHSAGVDPNKTDAGALFASAIIISVAIGYGYIPTYWGGEVRRAKDRMLPSMLLGAALASGILILTAVLAIHAFGSDFLGSSGFVAATGDKSWPFSSAPSLYALITLAHPHTWFAVLLGVTFVVGITGTILPSFLMLTRNALAWAIDRVVPRQFGDVNPRTHTPAFATLVMIVLALGYLALAIYVWASSIVLLFAIVALMALLVWMCTGIAAVLFPFRAKQIFEDSPINWRVGGIPVISMIGALDTVIMGFLIYLTLFTHWGPLTGLKNGTAFKVIAIEVGGLALIWLTAYVFSKRRGISLTLAQQALPPE
jgi:basic amino acid/polyamine antiporter, APA family